MDNRRRHERFTLKAPITLFWGWGESRGVIRNLSAGGARVSVSSAVVPTAGVQVDVKFALPDGGGSVQRSAIVRWSVGQPGVLVGLEFEHDLDAKQLEQLRAHDPEHAAQG